MLLSKVLNDFYVLPLGQSEIVGWNMLNQIHIAWTDSDTGEAHEQTFNDQEVQENPMCIRRGQFAVVTIEGEIVAFLALTGADLSL